MCHQPRILPLYHPYCMLRIYAVHRHALCIHSMGALQVTVIRPPKNELLTLSAAAASAAVQAASTSRATAEEIYSAETAKILQNLGPALAAAASQQQQQQSTAPEGIAAKQDVRLEVLKHSVGVVGMQWAPMNRSAGNSITHGRCMLICACPSTGLQSCMHAEQPCAPLDQQQSRAKPP